MFHTREEFRAIPLVTSAEQEGSWGRDVSTFEPEAAREKARRAMERQAGLL